MRSDMITTYAQYLGTKLLQPFVLAAERDSLFRSTTGKIEHVEGENDMLLAMELAEADISVHGRERKIRGTLPHFCWHGSSFMRRMGCLSGSSCAHPNGRAHEPPAV